MSAISNLAPFDEMGRVQMVVETPRGSSIKYKYIAQRGFSQSHAAWRWG